MLPTPSRPIDVRHRLLRAVDGVVYAVVTAAVAFGLGTAMSFGLGGGWTGVKVWLFLVGLFLFGLGTFYLRPRAAWKEGDSALEQVLPSTDDQGDKESPFQRLAIRFVPGSLVLPPDERWGDGPRLFLTSLLVLGASYAMEAYFGVGGGA